MTSDINSLPKKQRRPANAPEIDEALVWKTCDDLDEANQQVSYRSVTEVIGGSFSDVGDHVTSWKQKKAERHRIALVEIPAEIADASLLQGKILWKKATELASERLVEMGRQYDEQIALLRSQVGEYQTENRSISRRMAELEDEKETADGKLQELNRSLEEKKLAMDKSEAALKTAQERIAELMLSDRELQGIRAGLERKLGIAEAKNELDQQSLTKAAEVQTELEGKVQTLRGELGENAKKLEGSRVELGEVRKQLAAERTSRETLEGEMKTLRGHLGEAGVDLESTRTELRETHKQYKEEKAAREKAEITTARLDELRTALLEQAGLSQDDIQKLNARIGELEKQLKTTEESVTSMREDLKKDGKKTT